jgi:pantetheine-phosphate adenylyltransferase
VKRVVCPGSFDPITFGHLDIIERASKLFDEVVVAVLVNQTKSSLFTVSERIEMITEVTRAFPNVRVDSWSGLLVDYCEANEIQAIVKGLRAVTDFDYELQMSQINLQLKGVETLFMSTAPAHSFLSSSLVKEIASYQGDVSAFVPAPLLDRLKARVAKISEQKTARESERG